ncbi:alpha/beta fold hydrolase [Acinetobacter nectaris]|uniref:alpha/beta fold hydrolase n=1 Tax=Acinetobacter nectaris TaxID=1219382 RepID=UPI001F28680C|nr:alpha/beta hydrolase [Acinetobacter nectaris]MCF9034606.1 alpha/beta hydrolase [Acinetobacter nectaris]
MHHFYFLPGASGNTDFWQPLLQAYINTTHEGQIIAYPGFYHIPCKPHIQSFEQLSDHVLSKIVKPSILVAQSMGGLFAIRAALEKGDLVKGLVLVATSGGICLDEFNVQDWRADYHQQQAQTPNWFVKTQVNYEKELASIKIPVLLIWADADPISPLPIALKLQSYLPQAKLKVIRSTSHHFASTHTQELLFLINKHFNFK